MSNLGGTNGFSFNGEGNGNGNGRNNGFPGPGDRFEEDDDDHEHTYINIAQTPNLSAYEEQAHEVVTLEFHDRGLTLDFSSEEAEELGRVLAEVVNYLKRKRTIEP